VNCKHQLFNLKVSPAGSFEKKMFPNRNYSCLNRFYYTPGRLKGLVQFDYSNEKLPPGISIYVIDMSGKRYTEKMIKF
jgi:hypothetical protein